MTATQHVSDLTLDLKVTRLLGFQKWFRINSISFSYDCCSMLWTFAYIFNHFAFIAYDKYLHSDR